MQKAPSPRHCAIRLRTAVSQLHRQMRACAPADGISIAKLSALGQLHRLGPLSPSELAKHERVKLQSLTRLLAELEADGWLRREAHGDDARKTLLTLTPLGVKSLTADVHRREASLVDAIAMQLNAREQAVLLRACALIDRISDVIGPATSDPGTAAGATRRLQGTAR